MDANLHVRDFFPSLAMDRESLRVFLEKHELRYENDIEYAACFVDDDDEIMACGCCSGNILKCFAVNEEMRGQNLLGQLITTLVANRFNAGYFRLFVFTKPKNQQLFISSAFFPVETTDKVAMMENRPGGVKTFCDSVRLPDTAGQCVGAVVMNCNPFTLGHRYLVEYAAAHCDQLYLFVVEEDRSVFPFADRLQLVQAGTADLPNVHVVPGGPYMISSATFPTYFLKKDDDAVAVQATLDLKLFAEQLAPQLGITRRFVGEEPTCPVTGKYNQVMAEILPQHGLELTQIPRRQTEGGTVISASTVRECLAGQHPELDVQQLVPKTTYDYLISEQAKPVIDRLKG